MNDFEINADDMRKSAIELERLLDKYRNQPECIDGKSTWSKGVQHAYDKIVKYINMAKNGEIKEPLNKYFGLVSYFIDETSVSYTYPDLANIYPDMAYLTTTEEIDAARLIFIRM